MNEFKKLKYIFNSHTFKVEKLKNGVLYVSDKTFQYFFTNETGNNILLFLNGKNTIDDVIDKVSSLYVLPKDIVEDYVLSFINNMIEHKFVYIDGEISSNQITDIDTDIKRIYIDINNFCNMNCSFCYMKNSDGNNFVKKEISLGCLQESLVALKGDLSKRLAIYLTGGEPTLHSEFYKLVKLIKDECECDLFIVTNGTNFSDDDLIFLKTYVKAVIMTLYSADKTANDAIAGYEHYDKFMFSFDLLKKHELSVYLSTIPTVLNLKELPNLQWFAKDNGFKGLYLWRGVELSTTNESLTKHFSYDKSDYDKTINQLLKDNVFINSWKNNRLKTFETKFHLMFDEIKCISMFPRIEKKCNCSIGIDEIAISHDGSIYPCHMLKSKAFKIENVADYLSQRISFTEKQVTNETCNECLFWIFCYGGCRAVNYYEKGCLNSLSSGCEKTKNNIRVRFEKGS